MLTMLSPAFLITPITLVLLLPSFMILLMGSSPLKSVSATSYPIIATGTEDCVSDIEKYRPLSISTFATLSHSKVGAVTKPPVKVFLRYFTERFVKVTKATDSRVLEFDFKNRYSSYLGVGLVRNSHHLYSSPSSGAKGNSCTYTVVVPKLLSPLSTLLCS